MGSREFMGSHVIIYGDEDYANEHKIYARRTDIITTHLCGHNNNIISEEIGRKCTQLAMQVNCVYTLGAIWL